MTLQIYNTLTRKKEEFKPIKAGNVKMYVCGVTVYDYCHLGHGRAYVAFDVIYRYLKYSGYDVTYIRNITDIDDKIIARANEIAEPSMDLKDKVSVLTNKYIDEFHTDMGSLNILPPNKEPRATEYIPQMIQIIEKLVGDGSAYVVGGDVYFNVGKFKDYGKLSCRSTDELLAGARVEPDPRKKNPLDFSLWKEAKPNEPYWESPWGNGRPGWHIECSAMSINVLGEEFDIHGGGQDLIFPHHENEIAQSRGFTGKQPVHYWIHNGFVTINREKMSKSLGNFFTLKDIFKKYDPNVVRFFLLRQRYRSPIDFSDQLLDDAKNELEGIEECFRATQLYLENKGYKIDEKIYKELKEKFQNAMNDDFNTPQALAIISEIKKDLNNGLAKDEDKSKIFTKLYALQQLLDQVLGIAISLRGTLFVKKEMEELCEELELQKKYLEELDRGKIAELLSIRNYYRKIKKWDVADNIRKHLISKGYEVRDLHTGTDCIGEKI